MTVMKNKTITTTKERKMATEVKRMKRRISRRSSTTSTAMRFRRSRSRRTCAHSKSTRRATRKRAAMRKVATTATAMSSKRTINKNISDQTYTRALIHSHFKYIKRSISNKS